MALQNAYSMYQDNKIMTASPAELTLMLYEGAIKFCNIAVLGIEQNNFEKAHNNIMKTKAIITELRATLNFKYPVAQDFENVYLMINRKLSDANIRKDKDILEEVLVYLRDMRDTWKEVIKTSRSTQK